MFLARWKLNSTEYRKLGIYDNYDMHQVVCDMFNHDRIKFDVSIQRNIAIIYIQSDVEVVNPPILGTFDIKQIDLTKYTNGKYRIMVKLNATKQITIDGKKNKKVVPVVGEYNVMNWLFARQDRWGINIIDASVAPTIRTKAYKKKAKNYIVTDWHQVDMICEVIDSTLFQTMISNGIGKARSIGCSMLKVFKISN